MIEWMLLHAFPIDTFTQNQLWIGLHFSSAQFLRWLREVCLQEKNSFGFTFAWWMIDCSRAQFIPFFIQMLVLFVKQLNLIHSAYIQLNPISHFSPLLSGRFIFDLHLQTRQKMNQEVFVSPFNYSIEFTLCYALILNYTTHAECISVYL